jgi:hypothetical protein
MVWPPVSEASVDKPTSFHAEYDAAQQAYRFTLGFAPATG